MMARVESLPSSILISGLKPLLCYDDHDLIMMIIDQDDCNDDDFDDSG